MKLKIDNEFKSLIPMLQADELATLTESIIKDGCRDALVLWGDAIIDGHNRYRICVENNIEFKTVEINFCDKDDAKIWIIKNQMGRRNLSTYDRGILAIALEPLFVNKAKKNQGERTDIDVDMPLLDNINDVLPTSVKHEPFDNTVKRFDPINTRKELAKIANVSEGTIAKVMKIQKVAPPELKEKLKNREVSVNDAYKQIKKDERLQKTKQKESNALSQVDESQVKWTVTKDEKVITCDTLITDPPYGILDEPWEPDFLETYTKGWLEKWNSCNADFIISFWSQRYLFDGRKWFDESLSNYDFQQLLIWHYANNVKPQSRLMFKQSYEPIFLYRRKGCDRKIVSTSSEWGNNFNDFDCHVSAVPQSNFKNADMKQHPAQKPTSVMKWLINLTSDINSMICDPFAGSGTTGIAAVSLKRKFHGIEANDDYLKLAKERIATYGV